MFPCEICSKQFARKDALRRHVRCVHGQKQYECETCSEKFARKEDLRRHVRSLHGQKQHQCNICLTKFTRKDSLTRHIRCVHDGTKEHIYQKIFDHATSTECPVINPPTKKFRRSDPAESLDVPSTESNIAVNAPVHSPAEKKFKSGQKRHWKEIQYNDNEVAENDEAFDCIQLHWSSIRSFTRKGQIQSLYNFYYNQSFKDMIEKIAQAIMHNRKNRLKQAATNGAREPSRMAYMSQHQVWRRRGGPHLISRLKQSTSK